MVIGDLGIVDEPPSQRTLPGAGRQVLPIGRRDRLDDPRQRGRHILRQVPAVGARVADQLVPLVESLRHIQRLLRAEAEQPVGVPLQFRQVVERGGAIFWISDSIDSMAAVPVRARSTMRPASSPSTGSRIDIRSVSLSPPRSGCARNQVPW